MAFNFRMVVDARQQIRINPRIKKKEKWFEKFDTWPQESKSVWNLSFQCIELPWMPICRALLRRRNDCNVPKCHFRMCECESVFFHSFAKYVLGFARHYFSSQVYVILKLYDARATHTYVPIHCYIAALWGHHWTSWNQHTLSWTCTIYMHSIEPRQ